MISCRYRCWESSLVASICACILLYVHVCTHKHKCMATRAIVNTRALCMCVYIYACKYPCKYVCMYAWCTSSAWLLVTAKHTCVSICMYVWYTCGAWLLINAVSWVWRFVASDTSCKDQGTTNNVQFSGVFQNNENIQTTLPPPSPTPTEWGTLQQQDMTQIQTSLATGAARPNSTKSSSVVAHSASKHVRCFASNASLTRWSQHDLSRSHCCSSSCTWHVLCCRHSARSWWTSAWGCVCLDWRAACIKRACGSGTPVLAPRSELHSCNNIRRQWDRQTDRQALAPRSQACDEMTIYVCVNACASNACKPEWRNKTAPSDLRYIGVNMWVRACTHLHTNTVLKARQHTCTFFYAHASVYKTHVCTHTKCICAFCACINTCMRTLTLLEECGNRRTFLCHVFQRWKSFTYQCFSVCVCVCMCIYAHTYVYVYM